VVLGSAVPSATWLLAAVMHLVHRRPRSTLSFAFRDATVFIAFFDVFGLTLLFGRVTALVTAWHCGTSSHFSSQRECQKSLRRSS
jgi:hypothetical protein